MTYNRGAMAGKLKRLIPRFSLRTLVVFMLLVTSGVAFWCHRHSWYCERVVTKSGGFGAAWSSPDGTREVSAKPLGKVHIIDRRTGERLRSFLPGQPIATASFLDDDHIMVMSLPPAIWRRRYPEWWWGVFYLWELWLTVAFAGVFVWSVVRDRSALRRKETA